MDSRILERLRDFRTKGRYSNMMLPPNPGVLDSLVLDRQRRLNASPAHEMATTPARWRIWVGHALIMVGSQISGEHGEHQARHSALPRSA